MSIFRILYADHVELLGMSHALIAATRATLLPTTEALGLLRHALARKIRAHLEREALLVLAPLRDSADPAHGALARLYVEGLLSMRLESTAHHGQWTPAAALADITSYRRSARLLVSGLAQRIAWEEQDVFPVADALHIARPLRLAG